MNFFDELYNAAYVVIAAVCWMVTTVALIGVLLITPHMVSKAAVEIENHSKQ